MGRFFEKISFEQWQKDINDNREDYDSLELPRRHTKYSAAYDFKSPIDCVIKPGEIKKIPTGIKMSMNNDEMLLLVVRSSTGFKYNVRMTNQIGVFDKDYYNNESNEGHAFVSLQNEGDKDFVIKKGDRLVQGFFTKFLKVDNEEEIKDIRKGGLGSTNNN